MHTMHNLGRELGIARKQRRIAIGGNAVIHGADDCEWQGLHWQQFGD